MDIKLDEIKRIHLIGIGGCSMNGLAQILRARGYEVRGSDKANSPFTERLAELGIAVYPGLGGTADAAAASSARTTRRRRRSP